jgi:tRNA (guanine-N(7)-)-methyltransferase subunit TRM82
MLIVRSRGPSLCRFISAIHIPRDIAAHDILISGGGDPVIKIWQWRTGRRLYDVAIEEVVRPFIVVHRVRPKRGYDSDGERKPPSRRWLARQRRRQAKAAAATNTLSEDADTIPGVEAEAEADVDVDVEDMDENEGSESGDETVDVCATPSPAPGDPGESLAAAVLVVQKIETLRIDGRLVVVFSAVGCVSHLAFMASPTDRLTFPSAAALFWFALPPDLAATASEGLPVHKLDFGRPVVTFTPVSGSPDCVWVSLDVHWRPEGPSPDIPSHVKLVRLGPDSVRRTLTYSAIFSSLLLRRPKFLLHRHCYRH